MTPSEKTLNNIKRIAYNYRFIKNQAYCLN